MEAGKSGGGRTLGEEADGAGELRGHGGGRRDIEVVEHGGGGMHRRGVAAEAERMGNREGEKRHTRSHASWYFPTSVTPAYYLLRSVRWSWLYCIPAQVSLQVRWVLEPGSCFCFRGFCAEIRPLSSPDFRRAESLFRDLGVYRG